VVAPTWPFYAAATLCRPVANEHRLPGRHGRLLQRDLDQIGGGLAALDIAGEGGVVDGVLGIQGARSTPDSAWPAELASTTVRPRALRARRSTAPGSGRSPGQYVAYSASCDVRRASSGSLSRPARQETVEQLVRAHPDRQVDVRHRDAVPAWANACHHVTTCR
jgi:hypothetical protein